MIQRRKIDIYVKKLVEKNGLQKCFIPIIEEFFFRVADQCDWGDEELSDAASRFEKELSIEFVNMHKTEKDRRSYVRIDWNTNSICFDVNFLKNILKYDEKEMETFINVVMHEFGHVVQTQRDMKRKTINVGFSQMIFIVDSKNIKLSYKDLSINEFAEVINANRLQHGNLERDKYSGYENIQSAGRIILSSFGISELELADLQFETNAREAYEEYVANKLGRVSSKIYRDGFGEILDAILKFSYDLEQRSNLILQVDALQILSKKIFEERFEDIMLNSNDTLRDLAKLRIDETTKNNSLKMLFKEFNIKNSELQINYGTDIYTKLLEQGIYDNEDLKKLYSVECEQRIKIDKQRDKQNEKRYDNKELKEEIYQVFMEYPLRKIPLRDIPGVILSKIIGKVKRRGFKQNNLLPSPTFSNNNKYTEFASRISNLQEYEENVKRRQEHNNPKFREERNDGNANDR